MLRGTPIRPQALPPRFAKSHSFVRELETLLQTTQVFSGNLRLRKIAFDCKRTSFQPTAGEFRP